jgi:hypothetical protein
MAVNGGSLSVELIGAQIATAFFLTPSGTHTVPPLQIKEPFLC